MYAICRQFLQRAKLNVWIISKRRILVIPCKSKITSNKRVVEMNKISPSPNSRSPNWTNREVPICTIREVFMTLSRSAEWVDSRSLENWLEKFLPSKIWEVIRKPIREILQYWLKECRSLTVHSESLNDRLRQSWDSHHVKSLEDFQR